MLSKRKFIILFIFCVLTINIVAKSSSQSKIDKLEAEVKELDNSFNVSARKYVSAYFDLSDEYYKENNFDKAYENAIKGLRLDSYNLKMQLRAAEYEIQKQNYDLAYPRLIYILEKNEEEKIIESAENLLKRIPKSYVEKIENNTVQPMYKKTILLAFYPDVEDVYKKSITQRIEQEYKLTVETIDISFAENPKNLRDSWDDFLKETVNELIENNSEKALQNTLKSIKLTKKDLETKEGKEKFFLKVLNMSGYSKEYYESLKIQYEEQYDASVLISQIKNGITIKPECFGILAVTTKDIYSGEENNNFLFGLASKNVAVMSLNRFIKFTDDKSVAIKRTVMQAFSSVGHVIGIPRCSTPLCARAYPNSLLEQDEKHDVLCPTCIKNINSVYAKQ